MDNNLNNPIIYFFAKSNDIYFYKFEKAKYFLDKYQISNSNVYYDIYKRNNLKFKNKLNKILLSYSNVDLCILSITDLGRSMTDLLNIMKLCNEKNIRIFNFERNQFFDIKMFLVFADEQQKIISKQMEQSL